MKRFFSLMIVGLVFVCVPAYASIIGNPETVGKGKLDVSVDGEYVFDRGLKARTWNISKTFIDPLAPDVSESMTNNITKPDISRGYRQNLEVAYGLLDNLDLFVTVGGTEAKRIDSTYNGSGFMTIPSLGAFDTPMTVREGRLTYRSEAGFASGAGLKGSYDLKGGWTIGLEARYSYEENKYKIDNTCLTDIPGLGIAGGNYIEKYRSKITVQQWHIAPYIAKTIADFTPYVGVAYTQMSMQDKSKAPSDYLFWDGAQEVDTSPSGYKLKYINQNVFSPFVGLSYAIGKRWDINVEGRFLDETAVSLRGSYKF